MRLRKTYTALALAVLALMAACTPREHVISNTEVTFHLVLPQGIKADQLTGLSLSVRNVNTGLITAPALNPVNDTAFSCRLQEGFYDFTLTAGALTTDAPENSIRLQANEAATVISGAACQVILRPRVITSKAGFVIAEIFFTGTLTPEGKQYNGDKYFRIFNNSDSVLYADGLILMESEFLTTKKYVYDPNIMDTAMTVDALYRIPGTGHDVPVSPHTSLLLVDNAIDHRQANVQSFDLSLADFEWYDESTNANIVDIDNPAVPNLDKLYCYTLTIWVPHNRGFTAFALGRLPEGMSDEEYLTTRQYTCEYDLYTKAGVTHMSKTAYRFENAWIIDAVNCSVEAEFQALVTSPTLDCGWTHCGSIDHDMTRYGKSVRRRTLAYDPQGLPILQDTDNSSVDFLPEQQADPYYFLK